MTPGLETLNVPGGRIPPGRSSSASFRRGAAYLRRAAPGKGRWAGARELFAPHHGGCDCCQLNDGRQQDSQRRCRGDARDAATQREPARGFDDAERTVPAAHGSGCCVARHGAIAARFRRPARRHILGIAAHEAGDRDLDGAGVAPANRREHQPEAQRQDDRGKPRARRESHATSMAHPHSPECPASAKATRADPRSSGLFRARAPARCGAARAVPFAPNSLRPCASGPVHARPANDLNALEIPAATADSPEGWTHA